MNTSPSGYHLRRHSLSGGERKDEVRHLGSYDREDPGDEVGRKCELCLQDESSLLDLLFQLKFEVTFCHS